MSELKTELAARIWENNRFQDDFILLQKDSVMKSINGTVNKNLMPPEDVSKLIQSALILADCEDVKYRKAAYRIAINTFNLFSDDFINLPNILHVLFGKLGNFPAINYMSNQMHLNNDYSLPSMPLYEFLYHEKTNSILSKNGNVILTDFQRLLWNELDNNSSVSVSAPTSAGKSFALQQYLMNSLQNGLIQFVLYIVPTRALIHQVADSINELSNDEILVSTIPQTPKELGMERGVYVLTQERTHVLLETESNIDFKMVVIDEAQIIGEGARGVLLQVVIEQLLRRNPECKFFFGSPFSNNPDHFKYLFESGLKPIKEEFSPVAQNLIIANLNPEKPSKLSLSLYIDSKTEQEDLSELDLPEEVYGDEQLLSYLSYYLGRRSKNLIYSGSPAKCEDIADKIRQWVEGNEDDNLNDSLEVNELKEFEKLIREHIHKDYFLADMVKHGIAFHYGKMPTLIRKAIEYYFINNSRMRYLVCTSTLLHGVNLPAKNLFILKPSEGDRWLTSNATPMSSTSFWNLAGRAGRLGKDFEGNVYLINKSQWANDPTRGVKEHTIESSFYKTIINKPNEILHFATHGVSLAEDIEEVESTFVKLYCDYKQERIDSVISKAPLDIPNEFITKFTDACDKLSFDVPTNIVEDNVAISPFKQQQMYDYILNSIKKDDYLKLIPPHPQQSNAYLGYVRLLSRFERYFDGDGITPASGRPKYFATIALQWMRGTPYPQLIQNSIERNENKSLPTIVREMMDTIERQLRFKIVQQLRCYIGLLVYVFENNDLSEYCESIPAVPLYLEIGACSGTMVNLIGLGLSRTTSGLLNKKAANSNMDRENCIKWLIKENWASSDLPKVCINEIAEVLGA